jgi:hypothetical protein
MAHLSRSPSVQSGGLVLVQPPAWQVLQAVVFQYNPEALRRRIAVPEEPADAAGSAVAARERMEARERVEMELVFDAADDLEHPDVHPEAARLGLLPRLDALRAVAFPAWSTGASPVLLLLFGARRPLPVRVLALAVDEEALSPTLCPLRASARLELEVLSPHELPDGGLPDLAVQEALRSITVASASG